MRSVPIHELKRNVASTIDAAAAGETVIVTRHEHPIAMIVGMGAEHLRVGRRFGQASLQPALENATGGKYLDVLAADRAELP